MTGIVSYGVYVPRYRLQRAAVAAAVGGGPRSGTRSVASYDEDSVTLAVEAGRAAMRGRASPDVGRLYFATTSPAYLDKSNAAIVHAALALKPEVPAYDMVGSVRSSAGAIRSGFDAASGGQSALVVMADVRTGLPGAWDELGGGDGGAALVFSGSGAPLATLLAASSRTKEFQDRWRRPGGLSSHVWEERFGEGVYRELARDALHDALSAASLQPSDVRHLAVAGLHSRAVKAVASESGVVTGAVRTGFDSFIGNLGAAQPGLLLADALDRAHAGEVVVLVCLADGVDVFVLQATSALEEVTGRPLVSSEIGRPVRDVLYQRFLTWRGMLDRESPRRPEPVRPSSPASQRRSDWKFGFIASTCIACGARHLPPARVCWQCRTADKMTPERMADVGASIATFTVDHLAYSMSPPLVAAVLDFDGGGRYPCELTDVDPATLAINDRVEMTYRFLYEADGVRNYFWKGRPQSGSVSEVQRVL
jgi:hydroxymethylglutaryl-CoA synthase